ncbi:anti-sigma factor [Cohnella sp.]|uniref:anti-sigma factor family protein n=1 Tax=Cohnella sp. TaxID=1883426 RepID=UPI0035682527
MKCQEVMELMQRYIDGDLDQQETSLMMEHADRCSDCAAMLARLRKLSSELEQLPRVVPKFSIVDSILPELERLHAAGTVVGAGEAAGDSAVASPSPSQVRSNRPARQLFRKISGVVAAGVVVGLLLFTNPGEWLQRGGSSNDAAMPSPASAPMAKQEASLFSASGAEEGLQLQDQRGDVLRNKSDTADSGEADIPEGSAGAKSILPDEGEATLHPTLTGGGEDPAVSGLSIPAETADSPNDKWRAVAVEGNGTLQIYGIENNELVYGTEPKDGRIGLLVWSADSAVLNFTVTDAGGNATEWQLDMTTFAETKR